LNPYPFLRDYVGKRLFFIVKKDVFADYLKRPEEKQGKKRKGLIL
jgi:hypothetical protein